MNIPRTNVLSETQAQMLDALRLVFGWKTFSVDAAMPVLQRTTRASALASLNNLHIKGVLVKPYQSKGFYTIFNVDNPTHRPSRVVTELRLPGQDDARVPEIDIKDARSPIEWLKAIGVDIQKTGAIYLMNGRMPLTEEVMFKVANRHRTRLGVPQFELESAE